MKNNQPKSKGGARPGAGRKKGVPNKLNGELKEMILGALSNVGGVEYLERQAEANPTAFMTLVGKVLPMTVQGPSPDGAHVFRLDGLPWLKAPVADRNSA